jgi:hypothetical protein
MIESDILTDKYMISGVMHDGKTLWQTEASFVDSVLVPTMYRGYDVESLIRGGFVHIRMVGKHKQNSQELRLTLQEIRRSNGLHMIHMNAILFPLADKLAEEDKVFDALLGEDKSNGR